MRAAQRSLVFGLMAVFIIPVFVLAQEEGIEEAKARVMDGTMKQLEALETVVQSFAGLEVSPMAMEKISMAMMRSIRGHLEAMAALARATEHDGNPRTHERALAKAFQAIENGTAKSEKTLRRLLDEDTVHGEARAAIESVLDVTANGRHVALNVLGALLSDLRPERPDIVRPSSGSSTRPTQPGLPPERPDPPRGRP